MLRLSEQKRDKDFETWVRDQKNFTEEQKEEILRLADEIIASHEKKYYESIINISKSINQKAAVKNDY